MFCQVFRSLCVCPTFNPSLDGCLLSSVSLFRSFSLSILGISFFCEHHKCMLFSQNEKEKDGLQERREREREKKKEKEIDKHGSTFLAQAISYMSVCQCEKKPSVWETKSKQIPV